MGFTQRDIDAGTFPDFFEFTAVPDVETLASPKTGFVLNLPELRLGSTWRFRPDGATLYLEWYDGAAWNVKGTYT